MVNADGPSGGQRLESWVESWLRAIRELGQATPERRATVLADIHAGSQPTLIYYALLGISELIAGFALLIDSDATLIGANVVAPLMTPIFGVALGLTRGDLSLLRIALIAEFGGALVGVALCFGLGLLPFALEVTPGLLAQTRPTLLDLMVAALAGTAGALAMIDERVSPALPGVAIATALNPPIAAIGLCLALGAYQGAWGAFVLFFANVLAILAVAGVMFVVAGFVSRAEIGSLRGLARRFSVAVIGLLLVTGLLTQYLVAMVRDLRTDRAITETLDSELAHEPSTALVSVDFDRSDEGIEVLSTVRAPRVIGPERVKRIQDALDKALGEPVRLFVRCQMTKDVTATGSTNLRPYLSLNGKVTEAPLSPEMRLLQQAEQVAREVAAARLDIDLISTDLVQMPSGPVIVVAIQMPRDPSPDGVARFQSALRERLADPSLRVVVRRVDSRDFTDKGRILFGAAHLGESSDEARARARAAEEAVREGIQARPELFVTAIDAVPAGKGWTVRAEVVGPRVPTPAEVRGVEKASAAKLGAPVSISVRASADIVVTGARYEPLTSVQPSAPAPDTQRRNDMTLHLPGYRVAVGALVLGCFAFACAAPDTRSSATPLALERTHWMLVALGSAATPIAKTQTEAFLLFGDPPGRVSGSGGCNRLAGTYAQTGDALTFGPIAGTRMACADGMQVEDALGAALASTASFRIAGDRLELLDPAGALLATFRGRQAS